VISTTINKGGVKDRSAYGALGVPPREFFLAPGVAIFISISAPGTGCPY
jgi:hypothetical protein